jgi:hypothetical protein
MVLSGSGFQHSPFTPGSLLAPGQVPAYSASRSGTILYTAVYNYRQPRENPGEVKDPE